MKKKLILVVVFIFLLGFSLFIIYSNQPEPVQIEIEPEPIPEPEVEVESLIFTYIDFWFNPDFGFNHGENESLGTEGFFSINNIGATTITIDKVTIELRNSVASMVVFESSDWNKIQCENKTILPNEERTFHFSGLPFIESPLYGSVVVETSRGNKFESRRLGYKSVYRD